MTSREHLVAGALAAVVAGGAFANIEIAFWASSSAWAYKIGQMPDFDQRRQSGTAPDGSFAWGLPGNGGMYCVPTATLNMMTYAARHGFPEIDPGSQSHLLWPNQANYTPISFDLIDMGILMETGATTGTGGQGWYDGARDWVDFYAPGKFDVDLWYLTDNFTPNINAMGSAAINGSLVSFAYGRYNNGGLPFGLVGLGERTGGHVVTLAHAGRLGDGLVLGSRDPADDPDSGNSSYRQTQSTFGTNYYDAENLGTFICVAGDCSHDMTFINYDVNAETIRMVDGFLTMRPTQGYGFTQDNVIVYLPYFEEAWPYPLNPPGLIDLNGPVRDLALLPDGDGFYYLADVSPELQVLRRYDMATGEDEALYESAGGRDVMVCRQRQVYILEEQRIFVINPYADGMPTTGQVFPSEDAHAMTYDDATDSVVAISLTDYQLQFYAGGFPVGDDGEVQDLPAALGNPDLGEVGCLAMDPPHVGNMIWLAAPELPDKVLGFRRGAPDFLVTVPLPEPARADSVEVSDNGNLIVGSEVGTWELKRDTWEVVPDSPWTENRAGAKFIMSHSRTNFQVGVHDQPGWATNILPDELVGDGTHVPDCVGDLNDDGVVGPADLATLLDSWGFNPGHPADINGDQSVGPADLALVLDNWGPC